MQLLTFCSCDPCLKLVDRSGGGYSLGNPSPDTGRREHLLESRRGLSQNRLAGLNWSQHGDHAVCDTCSGLAHSNWRLSLCHDEIGTPNRRFVKNHSTSCTSCTSYSMESQIILRCMWCDRVTVYAELSGLSTGRCSVLVSESPSSRPWRPRIVRSTKMAAGSDAADRCALVDDFAQKTNGEGSARYDDRDTELDYAR